MPRERNRKYTASTRGPPRIGLGSARNPSGTYARGHSAGRDHGLHPARRWRAMVRIEHTLLVGVWPPNRAKAIARKPHHTTKVTSAAKERVLQKSKDHALGGDAAPLAADERRTRAQGYRTGAMQDPVCGLPRTLYY